MLYVYRRRASDSARALAEAMTVNCRKISDLATAHYGEGIRAGDAVVCWGETLAPINGVKILNGEAVTNKLEDAQRLRTAGVATVEVSATRPLNVAATPTTYAMERYRGLNVLTRQQAQELLTGIQRYLETPIAPPVTWLGRMNNHIGGADLLHPPAQPHYWSKKETLTEEFRIHVFGGKSIRAGVKVPRDGATPHAWVRSLDGGWRIRYDGFNSTKPQRRLAAQAVEALGLQFGAVDMAQKADGSLIVLEVNRAPGLEGNTIESYAEAIREWVAA